MSTRIKKSPDQENEVQKLSAGRTDFKFHLTPVALFEPQIALGIVRTLSQVVTAGHESEEASSRDSDGIIRAQVFEEGNVFMVEPPFDGYAADRYLMDFYDSADRDLCSRMHMHTGMRYVRAMTGPDTRIRVSGLNPIQVRLMADVSPFVPEAFTDRMEVDGSDGQTVERYNVVIPECAWVDMQIPRGVAHQFNAFGANAVIDTVHPEESIETFREGMARVNMSAQTVFLEERNQPAQNCKL